MFSQQTILAWSRRLVQFANGELAGEKLLMRDREFMRRLPFEKVSAAEYEALRAEAERDLRWAAAEWRRVLAPLHRLRQRAEPPRSGARAGAWQEGWARNPERASRGERWLARFAIIQQTQIHYADHLVFRALDAMRRQPPRLEPPRNSRGQLKVFGANLVSPGAFVALTIAELLGTESSALLGECELESCRKLFVQPLIGPDSKRTPLYCSEAHATTGRGRKKRTEDARKKQRRRRRK